jgi:hypothetical protein
MPALSFAPALSLLSIFERVAPGPLRTLFRTAGEKLNAPRLRPHAPLIRTTQDEVLARGEAGPHQLAALLREPGRGRTPTIVLGGFVPDSSEQVFLLRRFFLRSGDLYALNYPRNGFSLDLLCAQLGDLVDELASRGQPPVIFSVSFGSGVLLEWLRRTRLAGRAPALAGVVLVSPVACVADIIAPTAPKPTTLLGRALRPYLDSAAAVRDEIVERSRVIFRRMFEAGAQNKTTLATLMSSAELTRLHSAVMGTIRGIDATGACERVQALRAMTALPDYFGQSVLPLTTAPALVLFAEKEEAVLDGTSPTRFALLNAPRSYFPNGRAEIVTNAAGTPVQHASLIFHVFDFLPPITVFYQRLKTRRLQTAA